MRYLRLFWVYFRLGLMNELEYRTNFWVQLLQTLLGLGSALAGLSIIFAHTDTLGGWRPAELIGLLGVYFLVGGMINLVIRPSMEHFMEDIRLGTLDFTLTKPEDAQILVSIKQVQIWKMLDVLLGLSLLAVSLIQLGERVSILQALAFMVALLAGAAIVYSVFVILATCAFWVVKVPNLLVIFTSMYEAGRWPVGIYPIWLRMALTFIVPVAFAISVPAEVLAGRLTPQTLLEAIAFAGALLVVSRRYWSIGVRQYSGASA